MTTKMNQAAFPALPVALTGVFALGAAVLLAINLPAYGVFTGLLGLGASVVFWLRELSVRSQQWDTQRHAMAQEHAKAADGRAEALQAQLLKLQGEWVPAIENQLNAAKLQLESALSDTANTLGQVQNRLHEAGSLAGDASATGSDSEMAQKVQSSLHEVLNGINTSLSEKSSMFEEVQSFINSTEELARMASSVEELAAKTNLLALNAAIEAARAGEEGRGFSIVADEVRKLSMLSAETGQQIRQRVQDISAAARRAGEGGSRMQAMDGKLLTAAEHTVQDVIASFDAVAAPLRNVSQQWVEQTQQIASELGAAEAGLDCRDRVSALLDQVDESLRALKGQIAARRELDVADLMRQLGNQSSMADEHFRPSPRRTANAPAPRVQASVAPAAPSGGGKSGDLDITFF